MTEQASGRFESWGRKVDEHWGPCGERIEEDVQRVIAFLTDRVVPEVRENGSKALRMAAEQLARLADVLDRRQS